MEDTAIFRPAKRRKFSRQNAARNEGETDTPQTNVHSEQDSDEPGVTSILKLRRQQRSRMGGVQFSNAKPQNMTDDCELTTLMPAEPTADLLQTITDRFVGHSGQVVDVDKHMVAFIDSEMAKRRTTQASPPISHTAPEDNRNPLNSPTKAPEPSTRQAASLGLLNEVRLNPTEALPRSSPPPPKPRKPRLDRFGRPLPPRKPRKGPTDEDIARDKLVEDIMNESGLDVYQRDSEPPTQSGHDGDADSRLASQFQQEYIDQMQSRQQAQKKAIPGADPGQKGPKLGGSRQQRAAMRERELKEEKGKG